MVRCKLLGAEWSGNILACHIRGKCVERSCFGSFSFFDRNYDEFSAKWMISIVVDRRTGFEKKGS